jgi:hypothetical protein
MQKLDFAERDKCKPVLLRLALAGNLDKPLISLYGTEWRERGHGLCLHLSFWSVQTWYKHSSVAHI